MGKYMFENRPIDGTTRYKLQEAAFHGALVCTKDHDIEKAGAVYKLRDPCTEEVCFVFSDEVQQFSNPFRTPEEADNGSREYSARL